MIQENDLSDFATLFIPILMFVFDQSERAALQDITIKAYLDLEDILHLCDREI